MIEINIFGIGMPTKWLLNDNKQLKHKNIFNNN